MNGKMRFGKKFNNIVKRKKYEMWIQLLEEVEMSTSKIYLDRN